MKKKAIVAVVALVLVLCCAMGGTLAWLVDSTTEVKNTFTYGDINIKLEETTTEYKMIPGNPIAKDPTVTVEADSEACWLFVKVVESTNFDDFMTYEIAEGWTALDGVDGVYYREVAATTADTADTDFAVLKDNSVSVKNTVTKNMLNAEDFIEPTLSFTAYAVQHDTNITTAIQAWNIAMGNN